jgi:hypothetical protein
VKELSSGRRRAKYLHGIGRGEWGTQYIPFSKFFYSKKVIVLTINQKIKD